MFSFKTIEPSAVWQFQCNPLGVRRKGDTFHPRECDSCWKQ